MSLATFKRKSKHKYANARPRPAIGHWVPRGPFGPNSTEIDTLMQTNQLNGFSINGGSRTISSGRDMCNSKSKTPFHGIYARGNGGAGGQYYQAEPVMVTGEGSAQIRGSQSSFMKQSVLSTQGQLHTQYRYLYNGQYPHAWVQPQYTGNLSDSSSSGLYTESIGARHLDCEPTNNTRVSAMSSSDYIKRRQRKCIAQSASQGAFPFRVAFDNELAPVFNYSDQLSALISNILFIWGNLINGNESIYSIDLNTLGLNYDFSLFVPGDLINMSGGHLYMNGNPISVQEQMADLTARVNALVP